MRKLIAASVLLVAISGCGVSKDYVASDEKTRALVAPKLGAYIEADASMPESEKASWRNLLDSWKLRVEKNK